MKGHINSPNLLVIFRTHTVILCVPVSRNFVVNRVFDDDTDREDGCILVYLCSYCHIVQIGNTALEGFLCANINITIVS